MKNKPDVIPVVCAIIEKESMFLAARRKQGESCAGFWEFPGGKVREGESPESALTREIMEELAISIDIKSSLKPCSHCYPGKTILLIPFICSNSKGTIKLSDHDAFLWIDPKSAKNLEWAPADVAVLEQYLCNKVPG
jgi:8-oxo-dGTP diphosphatase